MNQVEMIDNKLMYEQVDKRKSGGLSMPMMASARLERSTLGRKAAAGWTRPGGLMRVDSVVTSLQGKNHGTKAGHKMTNMITETCSGSSNWHSEVHIIPATVKDDGTMVGLSTD
jgi:hypothetical protein